MTSDGIPSAEWDRVREAALNVVNASQDDDAAQVRAVRELFGVLDELEAKYGPLPSILATRADYVDGPGEAVGLLKTAYRTALDLGDAFNVVQISESLATTYIEETGDEHEGGAWLEAFRLSLENGGGEAEIRAFEGLRARLRNLQGSRGSQSKPPGPA